MALDQPLLIVPPLELAEGLDQLGDRGEVPDPEQVLLQGPDEAFGDAVGLRSRMHPIRTISLDVSA
jgi:hypothetical protein